MIEGFARLKSNTVKPDRLTTVTMFSTMMQGTHPNSTHQAMELLAIRYALEYIHLKMDTTSLNLEIFTDSQYSMQCCGKMDSSKRVHFILGENGKLRLDGWVGNWAHSSSLDLTSKREWVNSKKEPVKNREIIERILELIESVLKNKGKVTMTWVAGHTGNRGNELADKLATGNW